MLAARDSTASTSIPLARSCRLILAAHLSLQVVLLPPVDQLGERRHLFVDERCQVAVGRAVRSSVLAYRHRPLFLQQAVDGKAARVEPDVLCPGLLALQLLAQAVQERELLGCIQAFLAPFLDDRLQPLAQRLVERRVLFQADADLMADGVLHLARLRLVGPECLDLLLELRREELDLLHQDLNAVRNDGVGNQLPNLLPAARRGRAGRRGSGRGPRLESCPASAGRRGTRARAGPAAACPSTG